MWFKETVSHKKKFLASLLKVPLEQLASTCADSWDNAEVVTQTLLSRLCKLPYCQLLYAIDTQGHQLSANVSRSGADNTWLGQDLSARPYLQGILPFRGMILSAAYLSQRSMQPCITAIQAILLGDRLLGFVAADFHIKDLPNVTGTPLQRMQLYQSDQSLAHRQRAGAQANSVVDHNVDYLIYVLSTLIQEHGIFHCKLHFDSACACLWSIGDPLNEQVLSVGDLLNPDLFLRYPKRAYTCHTQLDADTIPVVFAQLKALRQTDDTVYLRSGSVNIINGRIGLTFSCDGSHYLSTEEFLNHDLNYWLAQDTLPESFVNNPIPN